MDFRTVYPDRRAPFSPKTRLAIRRARRLQRLAAELRKALGRESISQVPRVRLSQDPELVAARARETLGVPIEQQLRWRDEREALHEWQRAVEGTGVLVFQMSLPLDETRGFSLAEGPVSAVVLNTQDSRNARIFSLFHEYGHLLLGEGGVCDMEEPRDLSSETRGTERFCNHFAGALLVPKDALLEQVEPRDEWSDERVRDLGRRFKVSKEVVLRRLMILDLASRDLYRRKRREWGAVAGEVRRGHAPAPPERCIRENGVPFVSLVLETHGQEKITYRDVADYLAVQVKYLPKIERLLKGNT